MAAYKIALGARVDCVEIDASRSSDGVLFALHDRYISALCVYFIFMEQKGHNELGKFFLS